MTQPEIYLDHAATTPPSPAVLETMQRVAEQAFGNPSSSHGFGQAAKRELDDAREFLRGALGASRLVFTSGGTEADVLGLTGAVRRRSPGRVLVGAADHDAILAQRELLARSQHKLVTVPVRPEGDIDPEALFEALGPDVRAVSLLHGHNELGTLQPLDELVDTVRRVSPNAHIHVDWVQGFGKLPFDLDATEIDSVAIAGHKLHGPRGIGCLGLSATAEIYPLQPGGGQETGLRGGTENVSAAAGLATAAEAALSQMTERGAAMTEAIDTLFGTLAEAFPDIRRFGHPERRLPHILSCRIPGVVAETLQMRAAKRGVAFSTGAACHGAGDSNKPKPNHVLEAIGMRKRAAREVMRLSVGATTNPASIHTAADILIEEIHAMQRVST